MKIFYLINEQNEILEDGFTKFNPGCLEMDSEDYKIKNGYNGHLFFESYMRTSEYKEKAREWQALHDLNVLRLQRARECFPIVNRGQLWYSLLSADQKNELKEWYHEWLDVTKTQKIPEPPAWLK